MSNKYNQKKWEEDCNKIHNNKYDYSLVDLSNRREDGKIPIVCHEIDCGVEHGIFWQQPNQHKFGKGCPKCRTNKQDDIISIFKEIHGELYDYSLVEYNGMHHKIIVKCNKCGNIFEVVPNNHKKGRGCPFCALEKKKEKLRLSVDIVKERISKKFYGKYDLSEITYDNVDEKIKLICPEHGEFWQTPFLLFKGCGCPKCGQSSLENEIQVFLDKNNIENIYEESFEWLGKQTLDFYLPQHNVAIECQGRQHFSPQRFGGISKEEAESKYKNTIRLDEEKRKLCSENGVKLLYYSDLGIDYPYEVYEDKTLLLNEILKNKKK